jgi:hypothetical protein
MAKKRERNKGLNVARPGQVKLSPEESLRRVMEFSKRKERIIAAVRKGKNRGVSA